MLHERRVWITTWPIKEWTQLPDIHLSRWEPFCDAHKTASGDYELIVAGGYNNPTGTILDSVEIFRFDEFKWRFGAKMPWGVYRGGSVGIGDKFKKKQFTETNLKQWQGQR